MSKISRTIFVAPMLIALGVVATIQPVSASVEAECRQEAKDYDIAPELSEEYINGCIDSRGGESAPESINQDYVPPADSDDTTNSGDDSGNVTQ
jgi:hypothetical protein